MASDVVYCISSLRVGVKDVAEKILALTRKELREGVVGAHNLFVKV